LRRQDGNVTVVDVQDIYSPTINALNSSGTAAGVLGAADSPLEGFISTSDGILTYLPPVIPTGINDKGVVVGNVAYQFNAFIRTPDGNMMNLNAPGTTSSQGTKVLGINNAGWVVGYVYPLNGSGDQPFIWRPL
jgi:hypothetical protein